jgi:1,4-dihydroxy-2-naphthoate polyprenyltransferase
MAGRKADIKAKIAGWFGLSHPPFQTVGLLPFLLGTVLAWRLNHSFHLSVFILAILGVVLVILATHHAGEYFDDREDERSRGLIRTRFTGGSGAPSVPFWTSVITIVLAAVIGLILQFGLKTGPLTLLLGAIGALPGFFYAMRPLRLDEKGLGEFCIGFCYGWLPAASAFYIQTGTIAPCIHWMALPIGLSIFNVILLNEFSDRPADAAVAKTNLLIRLGKDRGMILYVLVSILSWVSMCFSLGAGIPRKALYLYLPVMAMSAAVSFMMARRKYEIPLLFEILCGLNIAVNLGTTLAYLLAFA